MFSGVYHGIIPPVREQSAADDQYIRARALLITYFQQKIKRNKQLLIALTIAHKYNRYRLWSFSLKPAAM
jgi:hypothetical protein